MKRRDMLKSSLAVGVAGLAPEIVAAQPKSGGNHFYELRTYELRSDMQPGRINDYFQKNLIPAMNRLGIGPVGCFSVISGMRSPALIVVIDYPSMAEAQAGMEKLAGDAELAKAAKALEVAGQFPYVRYESALLKAFDGHPKIEVPPTDEKRAPRVFEMRTYESHTATSLRNKIEMFNQEEIKIFRDCGFAPVFFGETVFGTKMPNLTYMVGFDNMAAREKAWDTFRVNPDWERIRNKPLWGDPEAVTNITASYLRPTAFSAIR